MRIFLGLGQPELGQAMRGNPCAQRVDQIALGEHRPEPCGMDDRIFNHAQLGDQCHRIAPVKGGKARIGNRGQNLARPIRTEIQAQQRIASAHSVIGTDHRGGNKLIGLARHSSRLHDQPCGQPTWAGALHHGTIGGFDPFPAIIAVHRVIAANHRGHLCAGGQSRL